MNIDEAIKYLSKRRVTVEKDDLGYKITNPQNVILQVTERAIIKYASELKNPPRIKSLVEDFHKTYWK